MILCAIIASYILFRDYSSRKELQIADINTAKINLELFRRRLEEFHGDCKCYPLETQGLIALVKNLGLPGWNGPYLVGLRIPCDPWGTPYAYQVIKGKPLVFSAGPDRMVGTRDDVFDFDSE